MSRPRAVVAIAALGLAFALAGCNDDDPGTNADPTTSPSATSSDGSSSASPSDDASPSVAPATGQQLKMSNATMNAPQGWKTTGKIVDFSVDAASPDFTSSVTLTALEYAGPTLPLDLLYDAVKGSYERKGYQRLPDQEIDGVKFYHVAGKRDRYATEDVFAVRDSGYETTIRYTLDPKMPAAEREKLIAEGLASFTFS
ncbi:hypothetical protein ASC77_11320 [Nocardioides sp. Root1257]|uniref:hypothetical protein n=1 Tax=unclassified Nocardioides TaxID=2615069 RepID=UPI0006F9ED2B|nr:MULTISPECIES: hypothetical protein [unclassified Nocardioides]KQW49270.1 hypothetical protein ASC77_11320 [Nocardioides sp. Root1257]KRC48444.1 hypothetical protein ASE24_11325 [Nocardioides sp. Root224]